MIRDKRKLNSGRKPVDPKFKKIGVTVYEQALDINLLGGQEKVREIFHKAFEKELHKIKKTS